MGSPFLQVDADEDCSGPHEDGAAGDEGVGEVATEEACHAPRVHSDGSHETGAGYGGHPAIVVHDPSDQHAQTGPMEAEVECQPES